MIFEIIDELKSKIKNLPGTFVQYKDTELLPAIKKKLDQLYELLGSPVPYISDAKHGELHFKPQNAREYDSTRNALIAMDFQIEKHLNIGEKIGAETIKLTVNKCTEGLAEIVKFRDEAEILRNSLQQTDDNFKTLRAKGEFLTQYADFSTQRCASESKARCWCKLSLISRI